MVFACYYCFVEENFLEENYTCVCGQSHCVYVEKIDVSETAFLSMKKFVLDKEYKKVLFLDNEKCKEEVDFVAHMRLNNILVETQTIKNCTATEYFAKNFKTQDIDAVVVYGKEELISIAKYYAYAVEKDLIIFPVGNFADFTFSSFARLYDGVQFCFYKTVQPIAIFVKLDDKPNKYQTYYLSSKFIAWFDNEFARCVFKKECCPKLADFFQRTINSYVQDSNQMPISARNIWTLIRLGIAMTYFKQTKYFFGGDKLVCDFLQSKSICGDFLELESLALKLVVNAYGCFVKNSQCYNVANMNLHIKTLANELKISSTEVIKRLGNNQVLLPNEKIRASFFNYQPYLEHIFDKVLAKVFKIQSSLCMNENIALKNKLNGEKISRALALSANFGKEPTLLGFIHSFGFMDKLLY